MTVGLNFDRLTFHCELDHFQDAQELSLVWTGTFVTRGKAFLPHQFSGVLPILVLMKLKSARPVLPLPWAQDSQTQLLYRSMHTRMLHSRT